MEFFRLSLRTPLYYRREKGDPFSAGADPCTERLFCYALPPAEAARIDPNPSSCLGSLIAGGRAIPGCGTEQGDPVPADTACPAHDGEILELSSGLYYFTQIRETLRNREELTAMAVELQKEGLWERLKLEETLYLRLLYEDGSPASQLWRRVDPRHQGRLQL